MGGARERFDRSWVERLDERAVERPEEMAEEKEEMDDKAKKGFWPCQSYKCTKSGSNHMNPKYAEKCTRCGAMKPLGAGSDVFNHGMSEKAYLQNQSKYR